jgi:hypothetical protein
MGAERTETGSGEGGCKLEVSVGEPGMELEIPHSTHHLVDSDFSRYSIMCLMQSCMLLLDDPLVYRASADTSR